MVFASQEFLLFLSVVLTLYAIATARSAAAGRSLLIAASLFFYGYWKPSYLVILVVSICANFVIGNRIRNTHGTRAATAWAFIGIAGNLGLIGYYKYFAFLLDSLNRFGQQAFEIPDIVLPIGISFFTFQQIGFLVDEYKGKVGIVRFADYFLFISFFPQLIAGPIVVQSDMLWQLTRRKDWRLRSRQLALGIALFTVGLFKKSVLIDPQVPHIDLVFEHAAAGNAVSFYDAWVGALGYSFQIYFDFSGYSDMAIGLAFLFGLRLPINFFSPYKATSIRDFWRRWHITLSRFLRDYLYIPLGGSRHGFARTACALLITMGLGGLWHGAGWTFVLWGIVHGALLVLEHGYDRLLKPSLARAVAQIPGAGSAIALSAYRALCIAVVFVVVTVAWVLFRAPDLPSAFAMLAGMFGATDVASISEADGVAEKIPLYLMIVWLAPNAAQMFRRFEIALNADDYFDRERPLVADRLWTYGLGVRWAVVTAIAFVIDWSFLSDLSPFIYFQF